MASLATPAFMAAPMAWQAECMRDDGSFGAWLRPWRIVPEFVFTFTFTVFLCCGLYIYIKVIATFYEKAACAGVLCINPMARRFGPVLTNPIGTQ